MYVRDTMIKILDISFQPQKFFSIANLFYRTVYFLAHLRPARSLKSILQFSYIERKHIQQSSVPGTPIEWNNHPGCPSPVDLQHGSTITKSWLDMEKLSDSHDNGRVGPMLVQLLTDCANLIVHGTVPEDVLSPPSLVLTAWCLLWRVRPQWPTNWIWMGAATGNWKRVPKFPKHSTFAGDACRFCRPPGKPHETKPSVNLKDQTDVRFFFFLFFFSFSFSFFSFPSFLRWGKNVGTELLRIGKRPNGHRFALSSRTSRDLSFRTVCVWNFVFLSLLSLHRLQISFSFFIDLSSFWTLVYVWKYRSLDLKISSCLFEIWFDIIRWKKKWYFRKEIYLSWMKAGRKSGKSENVAEENKKEKQNTW